MRYRVAVLTGFLVASMQGRAYLGGADDPLPIKDGRPAVATVNGESISLDELVMELDPAVDHARLLQGYGSTREFELLDRLVNVRLVVQEAGSMGLAEQAEIRRQVEVSGRGILRDVLMERLSKDVRADPAAVEEKFRELVKQWKTASLLFQDEAAARRARDEVAGGAKFDEVATRVVAAKTARQDTDDEYRPLKDYLPRVGEAIAALEIGQVSPVIPIQAGFVVVTVTAVRYPEDAEARAEAQNQVLRQQQLAVLHAHEERLRQDLVVVHKDVLDAIDYQAEKPGLDALAKDQRIVADIKGAAALTVGALTEYLRMQSFHGPDESAQRKRMDATKQAALDATLTRRLLNLEAARLELDKTHEYRDRVKAYEDGLVFDSFVQKVIVPDSKMTEEEVKRYYGEHPKEFSSPEMVRMRSLAFTARGGAEDAIVKLREGADFGWVVANAEGQVDKGAEGVMTLDARPITTESMPEGVQTAVAGAKPGEFRLYESPEGPYYVLAVQAVISPAAKPYEDVREVIAKKLYGQKLKQQVEDYLGKLRAASTIEIYLKKAE